MWEIREGRGVYKRSQMGLSYFQKKFLPSQINLGLYFFVAVFALGVDSLE